MPHKHTRQKGGDHSQFNLAPTTIAKPLPAFTKTAKSKTKQNDQKPKRRETASTKGYKEDDTPREFARLLQFQATKKRPSGLDDGIDRRAKKRKTDAPVKAPAPVPVAPAVDVPKIMPGERLADYAARVDQALPVGGLARKGKIKVEGLKERQTKTEKRLHKMYASWREEDAKRKDKLEEQQEKEEEEEDEKEAEMGEKALRFPEGRKAKRRRMIGEQADDDDDPWAVLKERRDAPKGLHDVVQAPPSLKVVPKEKFKVRNGAKVNVANIPTAAGSLKRREELSSARQDVIDRYRAMMKGSGGL